MGSLTLMAWDSVHPFECPTRVYYGFGAAAGLGERLRELGVTRAVLVSDPGVEAAGNRRVCRHDHARRRRRADRLHRAPRRIRPPPTSRRSSALYAERGCDGLVGLGGGSSMDAAKAASVVIGNGGEIRDYRGRDLVPRRGTPGGLPPDDVRHGGRGHLRRRHHGPRRPFQGGLRLAPLRGPSGARRSGARARRRRRTSSPPPARMRLPMRSSRISTPAPIRCSTRSTSPRSA